MRSDAALTIPGVTVNKSSDKGGGEDWSQVAGEVGREELGGGHEQCRERGRHGYRVIPLKRGGSAPPSSSGRGGTGSETRREGGDSEAGRVVETGGTRTSGGEEREWKNEETNNRRGGSGIERQWA